MPLYQDNLQPHQKKKYVLGILGVVTLLFTFGAGFFFGQVVGIHKEVVSADGEVDIQKVIHLYSKTRSSTADFSKFWELWDTIKNKYVEQPVDEVKLFYGAMQGMVAGLGDPYSVYFPPKEAQEFAKDLAGEFEGIGAEVGLKDEQLTIIAPLPDSPAEQAGLKAGDKVFSIDGTDTFGMTLEEAVGKIRGPGGTEVKLTISSNSLKEAREVKIRRQKINIPTIRWEMKEKSIAYLRVSYFNQDTWREFDTAVKQILQKKPRGVILDLRSNPGGFLDTSVQVASEWVPDGVIVRERMSGNRTSEHRSVGAHRFVGIPTVVLVDEGTASGSEIVAGALQDYGAAKVIGKKTYGKGSVQDFEVLPDGSALKLTIANWFTPKDRKINGEGVQPDEVITEMFTETSASASKEGDPAIDNGVKRAIELLKK